MRKCEKKLSRSMDLLRYPGVGFIHVISLSPSREFTWLLRTFKNQAGICSVIQVNRVRCEMDKRWTDGSDLSFEVISVSISNAISNLHQENQVQENKTNFIETNAGCNYTLTRWGNEQTNGNCFHLTFTTCHPLPIYPENFLITRIWLPLFVPFFFTLVKWKS